MVIVSHRVVHSGPESCFSLQWCQLYTKDYYHYTGWRNVKYFIIFCQPLWEPVLPSCLGGGIYQGHGINTDPTHWLGNWGVFIVHFRVWETNRRGGREFNDQVTMTMNRLSWMWCSQTLIQDHLSPTSECIRSLWMNKNNTDSQFHIQCCSKHITVICLSCLSWGSDWMTYLNASDSSFLKVNGLFHKNVLFVYNVSVKAAHLFIYTFLKISCCL